MRSFILLISLMTITALQAQVDLSARVDTNAIRIGEQTKVTLEVSYTGEKPEVKWPLVKDTLQRFVEVVDPGVIDTIYKGERATQRQEIIITSWDSGYFAVPPFRFTINGNERETDPFLLAVHTVEIDTTAAPMELKSIYEQAFSWRDWFMLNWPYLAIAGGVLAIVFIIYLLSKKKKTRTEWVAPEIKIPADEKALTELSRLRQEEAHRTLSTKAYFTSLTDVLRQYLEDRFDIQAMEQTTAEISEHLRYADIKSEEKSRLHELLMRADMAKFAKEDSAENVKINALDKAIDFVKESRYRDTTQIVTSNG